MNQSIASFHLGDLATLVTADLDGNSFIVEEAGINYPVKLKLLEGADKLFIMLNGAVDRNKSELPVFARWNWGKILGGHVLAVCDPTLYMSESLSLGWFLGRPDLHAIPGLVRLAEAFRERLGVEQGRMIFYGSSGGGFAAMIAACNSMQGRAIAVNPQTDIFRYHIRHVQSLVDVLGGESWAAGSLQAHPERWQVLPALAQARTKGEMPRIVVAQNQLDGFHFKNHFQPFVCSEEIPKSGGVNSGKSIMAITYSSEKGHGAEPPELVKRLGEDAIPFLLRKP
jgi:hypothetical protein